MAQDVTIAGASYEDVPSIDVPTTGGGTSSFFDVSDTTATAADVASGKSFYLASGLRATGAASYAGAPANNGNANRANAILYGTVDSTSTATVFTATVEGLTELVDGTTVMLHNGVVTSASGFTVNINGLGAKKCYNNMTNATQDTTIFNVAYTMLFVYSTSLDSGNGGWWIYRGYDANTNTIGYQLRTNNTVRNVSDTARYYKIYFTSANGQTWVPASVNSTNNATSARPVNQRPIDPFGPIVYTSAYTNYTAGSNLAATTIWEQYNLTLGYSFNRTGAALTMTSGRPVYVKCAPQADGSAIMDASEPVVQALPTSKDGKIYIYLGLATSATSCELQVWHPVYWHDGTGIRLWTGAESGGGPEPSSTTPAMDGTAAVGTATTYARADHVHPTDTSRQATLVSGTNIKTINNESILGEGNITIEAGGGGGLVINVVVDSSGNVVSHDADTATCLDFAQAAVNNSDASAVAYVRVYSHDDEDDIYRSYVYRLPLISANNSSYGGGQYEVDGGIQLYFGSVDAVITGSSKMSILAKRLHISTMNDDPEMPVDITYTDKRASSNS